MAESAKECHEMIRKKITRIEECRVIPFIAIRQGYSGVVIPSIMRFPPRHHLASLLRVTMMSQKVAYATLHSPHYRASFYAVGCHGMTYVEGGLTL